MLFFSSPWNRTCQSGFKGLNMTHSHERASAGILFYTSQWNEWRWTIRAQHSSETLQCQQMGKHLICACSVSLLLWWQHAKTGNMMTWTWLTDKRTQRRLNTDHYPGKVSGNISKSLAHVFVWRSLTSRQTAHFMGGQDDLQAVAKAPSLCTVTPGSATLLSIHYFQLTN